VVERFSAERKEMMAMYNDSGAGEETPLTAEEFTHRLHLLRAARRADGAVLLSYNDGPTWMFGRHLLDAEFGPDNVCRAKQRIGN
jgi:hypothetical protein